MPHSWQSNRSNQSNQSNQSKQSINQSINRSRSTNQSIFSRPSVVFAVPHNHLIRFFPGNGRYRRSEGSIQEGVGTSAEALSYLAGLGDDGVAVRQARGGQVNTSNKSDRPFFDLHLLGGRQTCARYTVDHVYLVRTTVSDVSAWHGSSALLCCFCFGCFFRIP